MHVRHSIELAAIVADHGPILLGGAQRLCRAALENYWTASKCRLDRWCQAMKWHSAECKSASPLAIQEIWRSTRAVIEEILTSEILTRVWAALCCGYERKQGTSEAAPIVRNVLAGHLEARHRALNLMIYAHGLNIEEAATLNQLRRWNERWTDVLLSSLVADCDVAEFAFHESRVRDFASQDRAETGGDARQPLLLARLQLSSQQALIDQSPCGDLNRRIAGAILSCFLAELFDSTGLPKSLWMVRLGRAASDTQGTVEDLLDLDRPQPNEYASIRPRITYPRRGDILDN